MKKWIVIAIIIATLLGAVIYYYINKNDSSNNSSYEAERTSTENNNNNNNEQQDETSQDHQEPQNQAQEQTQASQNAPTEAEEISSFSTKIYTKDSSRQNNITITCSTLNDTDVADGATFSFCDTVGRASPSKGYTKADIFTNGKKTKGYGGGNCQISTTLYNAVLKVPSLKVTERHEHSNKVPYIQSGKDAAVSYGTYDFKFVNNTGNAIRIKASHTSDSVTIRLVKLV